MRKQTRQAIHAIIRGCRGELPSWLLWGFIQQNILFLRLVHHVQPHLLVEAGVCFSLICNSGRTLKLKVDKPCHPCTHPLVYLPSSDMECIKPSIATDMHKIATFVSGALLILAWCQLKTLYWAKSWPWPDAQHRNSFLPHLCCCFHSYKNTFG